LLELKFIQYIEYYTTCYIESIHLGFEEAGKHDWKPKNMTQMTTTERAWRAFKIIAIIVVILFILKISKWIIYSVIILAILTLVWYLRNYYLSYKNDSPPSYRSQRSSRVTNRERSSI
jgi:hypothetical protein